MNVERPALLLGMDFGRPAEDLAELHFYYRNGLSGTPRIDIEPPLGWTLGHLRNHERRVGQTVIGGATLRAAGTRFVLGSPVAIRLTEGRDVDTRTLDLTSDCATVWTLVGPIPVPVADGLTWCAQLDAAIDSGTNLPSADGQILPEPRPHIGLQCSGYVNLTAFLENIYGPVPSGDYKVYRRIAYAKTFFHSREARSADLELIGEDRFRVWLNGCEVLSTSVPPTMAPAIAPVTIVKGWNRLLLKVTQDATREWGGRRWGFYCRLLDADREPIGDLVFDVLPPDDFSSIVR